MCAFMCDMYYAYIFAWRASISAVMTAKVIVLVESKSALAAMEWIPEKLVNWYRVLAKAA